MDLFVGAEAHESEYAHVLSLAREIFEELGTCGLLRAPRPDEPWSASAPLDTRLKRAIESLRALAEPFQTVGTDPAAPAWGLSALDPCRAVVAYADDAMVADPMRTFARAFTLCSFEGPTGVEVATLAAVGSDAHTVGALRSAFALSENPHVPAAMTALLRQTEAARIRVGLDVLRARGALTVDKLIGLNQHPDVLVRTAVVEGLPWCPEASNVVPMLEEALATDFDQRVQAAAAESLVMVGARSGLHHARAEIGETDDARLDGNVSARTLARLLRLVGVAGGATDALLLLSKLAAEAVAGRNLSVPRALGWLGNLRCVDQLLEALSLASADPEATPWELEVEDALERLTGFGIAPGRAAYARLQDQPRPNVVEWRRKWDAERGTLSFAERHRFGKIFDVRASLQEIEHPETRCRDRRALWTEIAVYLGRPPRELVLDGWNEEQRAAIASLRRAVEGLPASRRTGWPVTKLER